MDFTLAGVIRERAAAAPEAPFITCGERVISCEGMDARSSQVAQALLAEGVGEQDRIAFLDKNGPEYFEVVFGGGKANVVTVAVNWRLAGPEIEYTVNDAEARVLVVGSDFVDQLDQIEGGLTTVKKIVVIGGHPRHESYEQWVGRFPATDPGATANPDDVAMQLYTSGTTGLPKGAMITNGNLAALVAMASDADLDGLSVSQVTMPLFHIGGSGWALIGMALGCHSILHREFVPAEVLDAIPRHGITNAIFVPAMLQALSNTPGAADGDYSTLRSIVYGASPITNDVLLASMATFGCNFIQVYGLTETTGAITNLPAEDHDPGGPRERLLRSAGKPYPHVRLRIVDPATGDDLPPGQVGELWTLSTQNMRGYWHKPDETTKSFTADGWLKTGDAGYLDGEGYLFLTDRIKDMIVSGGENVYPIEVENVLAGHPAVADVAVIGVPHEKWGETVKAIVVRRAEADPTVAELIDFTRQRLAGFKCPTSIDFIAEIPRNPSGKILKRELREPYWAGRERHIN